MVGPKCDGGRAFAVLWGIIVVCTWGHGVWAQTDSLRRYDPASEVGLPGRGSLDLLPSNPLGLPGSRSEQFLETDRLTLTGPSLREVFSAIPNVDFGFTYVFGKGISTGEVRAAQFCPVSISPRSLLFGSANLNYTLFFKENGRSEVTESTVVTMTPRTITTTDTITSRADLSSPNRLDFSVGGGYRRLIGRGVVVGANAFLDSSRIVKRWYSSWGWGLEMEAITAGGTSLDMHFNHYGNLFDRTAFINAFRNHGTSFDCEAGYSMPLWNGALDLRLKANAYGFNIGELVYGWRAGADVTTRNGLFTASYEYSNDRIHGDYHSVQGSVNLGFDLSRLARLESPFELPEPVFASPRNIRRILSRNVRRNWRQPVSVLLAREVSTSTSTTESRLVTSRTITRIFGVARVPGLLWDLRPIRRITRDQLDGATRVEIIARVVRNGPGNAGIRLGFGRRFIGLPPRLAAATVFSEPFTPGDELRVEFTGAEVRALRRPNLGIRAIGIRFGAPGSSGPPVVRLSQLIRLTITINVYR